MALVPCSPCMPHALVVFERTLVDFDRRGLVRPGADVGGFVVPVYVDRTEEDLRNGFAGLPMRVHVCEVRPRRNPYLPPGDRRTPLCDDDRRVFGQRMAGWCFGWGARLIEDAVGEDNVMEFRTQLAVRFAREADDAGLHIGMGCGVVVAERL